MSRRPEAPGPRLLRLWGRLAPLPGGRWLFGRMLSWMVPYTGTIRPRVEALAAGHAQVALKDRRRVRNHLRSVHAVALTNLGELATGLAMLTALPGSVRGIVTGLETRFLKKARGTLTCECRCEPPTVTEPCDVEIVGEVRDSAGDVVSRTTVTWRLAPL